MRYRPFGRSGMAASSVALNIGDAATRRGPDGLRSLIFTALEHGVNTYHIAHADPAVISAVGQALSAVERNLLLVGLRLGVARGRIGLTRDFSPEALTGALDGALHASGLGHFDMVILDEPGIDELPRPSLEALKAQRSTGRVNLLGVAGGHDAMDFYVSSNNFDVLMAPVHMQSGWKERARLKAATALDMGVIAYGWCPEELAVQKRTEQAAGLRRGLFGGRIENPANPLEGVGTYAFLHQTKNWTAEDICLAHTLTDPAVSTALIDTGDAAHVAQLASVPDRDMPPGVAAQIEMARFGRSPDAAAG